MSKLAVGYALSASFCTFAKSIEQIKKLVKLGYDVVPIMSFNASSKDTRFGTAESFIREVEKITDKKIIRTIEDAEPIGPKKMCDILVVSPCTGNTMSKIANAITDTPVTMAVKSHLRIQRPVLLAIATNDGLGASAINIGKLLNTKNIYFVPMSQDDCVKKPNSLVCDFTLIPQCVELALKNKQHQPVFI
ncbi:MAG: dipicolinate synthase subunit B [Ruminococcus sp.]|nr:dipicolinate synthase subunit B [Ruminococcus sp.]